MVMNLNTPHTMLWYMQNNMNPPAKRKQRRIAEATEMKPNAAPPKKPKMLKDTKKDQLERVPKVNPHHLKTLKEFSKKRYGGAKKIAVTAHEKGGYSLLTYNHFRVKLPYYQNVSEGKFDPKALKKEYESLLEQLNSYKIEKLNQKKFQELVGKIEVIGELLIMNEKQNRS